MNCPHCSEDSVASSPTEPNVGVCFDCVGPVWITETGTAMKPNADQLHTISTHEMFNKMVLSLRSFHDAVSGRIASAERKQLSMREAMTMLGRDLTLASMEQLALITDKVREVPSVVLRNDWSRTHGYVLLQDDGPAMALTSDDDLHASVEAMRRALQRLEKLIE